jgi:hypothetical protein
VNLKWLLLLVFPLLSIINFNQGFEWNIASDNSVYHSGEELRLNLTVDSPSAGSLKIWINGINGRVDISREENISAGKSTLEFSHTLPRCNVCGGISQGNYSINCSVMFGKKSENRTIWVEIKQ